MLKDKDGSRLFRKVLIKVVFPDAIFPPKTFVQHAGPHQGYGSAGVDAMLMQIADHLDTLYPFWEFRAVELKPEGRTAKYVFTFAGYRAVPAPSPAIQDNPTESSTLEPGSTEDITLTAIAEAVGTTLQDLSTQVRES